MSPSRRPSLTSGGGQGVEPSVGFCSLKGTRAQPKHLPGIVLDARGRLSPDRPIAWSQKL